MIKSIIRLLVIGIVLYIIYYIFGLIVAALSLPGIVLTLVMVILLLTFVYFLLKAFDINI
jgi:hypothetical protein